jgi:uncharacterized protein (TIGR02145 family)
MSKSKASPKSNPNPSSPSFKIPAGFNSRKSLKLTVIILAVAAFIAGLDHHHSTRQPRLTMQGWDDCAAYPTPSGDGYTPIGNLIDARDGKSYEIRKFSDGNCWMADNLRYGGIVDACAGKTGFLGGGSASGIVVPTRGSDAGEVAFTAKGSADATGQFGAGTYGDCRDPAAGLAANANDSNPCNDGDAKCGYYYSWQAAMQDPGAYFGSDYTTPSYPWKGICPAGWHVPNGGGGNGVSEFVKLANCANGDCNAAGGGKQAGFFQPGSSWKGVYSGFAGSAGSLFSQGSLGYFWSSAGNSAASANGLAFGSASVLPEWSYGYYRGNGFAVRCIKD